jgi:hypothetical protein
MLKKWLWLCALGVTLAGAAQAQDQIIQPGESGTPAAPSQPGTVDSISVYYGPIECFGAQAVVAFITTTDADSFQTATFEVSDDSTRWVAPSYISGEGYQALNVAGSGPGSASPDNHKMLNGRVGHIILLPSSTSDPTGSIFSVPRILDKYCKVKLQSYGQHPINGVSVRVIMLYGNETHDEIRRAVYTWQLPSD